MRAHRRLLFAFLACAAASARAAEPTISFDKDVAPLLAARCLSCHGEKKKGNLDLRTRAGMVRGGDTGPALVPGSADKSPLFDMVRRGEMPPKKDRLTDDQLAVLRKWIDAGAPGPAGPAISSVTDADRRHWAFQKPARPPVPPVRDASRVRTPVDQFLLGKLEARGLTFAPEADRRTLVRRASFDLIGLPPTPEEMAAFLADDRPDAYERLIDRLLASPHFGERWGRHWLDASGYVDVTGTDNDAATIKLAEGKWRYRDYVIRAFNQDKPFDRFLTEQLAGDELVDWRSAPVYTPEIQELLIATTFLRCAADDTDERELNVPGLRHNILQRTAEVVAGNLLALTVNCAKCHDHKYDPLPQQDYYRLVAVFSPAFNPESWRTPAQRAQPDVSAAVKADIDRHNALIDGRIAEVKDHQAALLNPCAACLLEERLTKLPEAERDEVRTAFQTAADKRTPTQNGLVARHPMLKVKPEEARAVLSAPEREELIAGDQRIAELNAQRRTWGTIQAVYDVGAPTPTHLLRRGNHETPGEEVQPGFLSVLCDSDAAADLPASRPAGASSGRRLALARWLTTADTPAGALVARVQVNRVWQQLFGRGLVATADNFGRAGAAPTHPELLDWLATEFVRQRWQFKPMLTLLMTSTAYRQASAGKEGTADKLDPANDLLWKMRLRRLESEAVRDALLAVGGNLDAAQSGPPVALEVRSDGRVVLKGPGRGRRSVYVLARRNYHLSLLDVFDQPVVATNCTGRMASAVVSQSLTMLNDSVVREQADAFAARVHGSAGTTPEKQIDFAFQVALGRSPTAQETTWCSELLRRQAERLRGDGTPADAVARQALAHLCHVLLNTSEFLYVP